MSEICKYLEVLNQNQQLIYDEIKKSHTCDIKEVLQNQSYIIDYLDKLAPVINEITVNTELTVKLLEEIKKKKGAKTNG